MNVRIERINSEILRELSAIIRSLKDPRITGLISVLSVDTAKDLKTAKVYVSIFEDDTKKKEVFDALVHSGGFIRRELSNKLRDLKSVPQINFILDTSMEYSQKINTILEGIAFHDDNGDS